jgi:hypothetical protein
LKETDFVVTSTEMESEMKEVKNELWKELEDLRKKFQKEIENSEKICKEQKIYNRSHCSPW